MVKILLAVTGCSGFLAVGLGAFAAHGLRGRLEENLLHAFETGVAYHLSHTLALFGCSILMLFWGERTGLQVASIAFLAGIVLFSGSLYLLALTGMKWLGPVTPLGGLCFLAGWLALAWSAISQPA